MRPVSSTAKYDMAIKDSRELEPPNDVLANARKFCMGGEPWSAAGLGGLEYVGLVRGDGNATGECAGSGIMV